MLVVRELSKVFPGGVQALMNVSLEVHPGLYGLLGPNGAGKSTFMRIISGVMAPSSGIVQLDGEDVLAHPERLWRRLGYLPQDFGFYPHLTGAQMLEYLLRLKGVTGPKGVRTLVHALLERVNLGYAADRKVKGYSGGMRQRLGIAQAIAGDPRLLIVDEPTVGLDPEERQRFYRILAELAEDRIVILSTHIVEDVAVLCRRFAVIRQGIILAETTPCEAKTGLERAVYEGHAERRDLESIRARYRVTQAVIVEGQERLRIHAPDGEVPPGFRKAAPTLEDAYMVLMRQTEGVLQEKSA